MCDPPILLGAAKSLVKNMEVPAREAYIDNFGWLPILPNLEVTITQTRLDGLIKTMKINKCSE